MTAYWRRPLATAAAFDAAGYFCTGDVVRRRAADGAVAVLGRLSRDVVKVGGHKVSALEVEGVLGGCPGVADVAVVGIPDADRGEVLAANLQVGGGRAGAPAAAPAAAVGGMDGDVASAAAVVRLRAWAASQLEPPKVPRAVQFVPALPANALGKVLKAEVAVWFAPSPTTTAG